MAIQIIEENRRPTKTEQFNQALGGLARAGSGLAGAIGKKKLETDALKGLNLDPLIMNLPKEAQAEYFKNQFTKDKPLSPLQLAQLELANKRGNKLDREERYFNDLENKQIQENEPVENLSANQEFNEVDQESTRIPKKNSNKNKPPHTQAEIDKATVVNPQIGNNYQRQNEEWQRQQEHQQRIEKDEAKINLENKKFFHKESAKYDEELINAEESAQKKNRALERQMKDVHNIGWWDRAASAFFSQTPYGDLVKSKTAQEFDANTLPQMEGQRQILGGILSDSDIRLLMQKIVTASKDPKANETIGRNMIFENNLKIAKARIGEEIKHKNGGYRPANYTGELNRIYNERYGQDIQDNFNNVMSLPDDKSKLQSIGRRKVPPGTLVSDEAIDMYLELANNDRVLMKKMMAEDNYDTSR